MKNISLRALLLLTISISMVIIISLLSYFLFTNMSEEIILQEYNNLQSIADTAELKLNSTIEEAKTSVLTMANNQVIKKRFAERDREALRNMLLSSYKAIDDKMAQFQFHLPDSTSFLRLHNPDKYGDSLKDFRFTVNKANADRKLVSGIEEGRGGYGLRVVSPVSYQGEHIGTVEMGADLGETFLQELNSSFRGEYYIYSLADSSSVAWEDNQKNWIVSTENSDPHEVEAETIDKIKSGETVIKNTGSSNFLLLPFDDYRGETAGYIKAVYDRSEIVSSLNSLKKSVILFAVLGILFVIAVAYYISRKIFNPLDDFKDMFAKMALGDLSVSYPLKKVNCSEIMDCGVEDCPDFQKDGVTCWFDVGSYAPQFGKEIHCPKITEGEYESCEECKVYKKVNRNEIETLGAWFNKLTDVLKELMSSMKDIAETLAASSQELTATGEELSASAEEVGNSMQQVASGAEEQSAQVEETSATINELGNQIQMINNSSDTMAEKAENVMDNIDEGNKSLGESENSITRVKENTKTTSDAIDSLGSSSREIGEIVNLINDIAAQTNLLALNAAIEAARAGEAGRGFSVVADEIRELAEQSASATEDITKLINSIQKDVGKAVKNMDENESAVADSVGAINVTSESFKEITEEAEELQSLIENIRKQVDNMNNNSQNVKRAVDEISQVSEQAAANAEEVAASSEQQSASTQVVVEASTELVEMVENLNSMINRFKY
ncbi:MAG: methyl-accepting chemotaxis protein [Bacillota bacterium]